MTKKVSRWEIGKGVTRRKRLWLSGATLAVAAVFMFSGLALFAQPSPQKAAAADCVDFEYGTWLVNQKVGCVERIQRMVRNLRKYPEPFPTVAADGYYGNQTASAVRQFQRWERLSPVDGIVGEDTWRRLCNPRHTTTHNATHWAEWYNAARPAGCDL